MVRSCDASGPLGGHGFVRHPEGQGLADADLYALSQGREEGLRAQVLHQTSRSKGPSSRSAHEASYRSCLSGRPQDHSSGKRFSDVLNEVVGGTAAWPDEEVEQLMMLVQTMPTLLPCQMVDVIVTSVGLPKYTCYDVRTEAAPFRRRSSDY